MPPVRQVPLPLPPWRDFQISPSPSTGTLLNPALDHGQVSAGWAAPWKRGILSLPVPCRPRRNPRQRMSNAVTQQSADSPRRSRFEPRSPGDRTGYPSETTCLKFLRNHRATCRSAAAATWSSRSTGERDPLPGIRTRTTWKRAQRGPESGTPSRGHCWHSGFTGKRSGSLSSRTSGPVARSLGPALRDPRPPASHAGVPPEGSRN